MNEAIAAATLKMVPDTETLMSDRQAESAIAIVGLSGRFPGARDVAQFWENLKNGVESISFFDAAELAAAGVDPAALHYPGYVNAGGVLEDIELFDASFFGYTPREAEVIDPQQRLFLECAWHALEDAGYAPGKTSGPVGVFAGASMGAYIFNLVSNGEVAAQVGPLQLVLGNDKDYLCTRVSYKLDLRGPSVTVQTACSTSLSAVYAGCQSLLDRQCDMALAGGVGIRLPQRAGYLYQEGGINSPDGHCRPFDARAKGTVAGNGLGIVVLKRYEDAVRDRDRIRAVILGTAANNDGSAKVGYSAPSVHGQSEVIAMAHAVADVEPESISYIEAHGTATPLGDPIEISALGAVFGNETVPRSSCGLGSVKSNIGHLDAASGVAGLIKTVLMLENGMLVPSLHYQSPNPEIDFANSPFYVVSQTAPWPRGEQPRRAGVSSFGIGGTNVHVVLQEPPPPASPDASRSVQLLTWSARNETGLEASTEQLSACLKGEPRPNLADLAYTQKVGRREFAHRRMLICRDLNDAVHALRPGNSARVRSAVAQNALNVAFMFPGQGSQRVGMGAALYESEPAYRDIVDACAARLQSELGRDIRDLLVLGRAAWSPESDRELEQTALAQPALFVVEYALAQMWMGWGVQPAALIGHSLGEYVAACLAGVFSLEDALILVAARGRLMQEAPFGSMLSVQLAADAVAPELGRELSIAAVNGPSLCVVSGPDAEIERLQQRLNQRGAPSQKLRTSHAFHSSLMEPVIEPFRKILGRTRFREPRLPFVSNVTGKKATPAQVVTPEYWLTHLRQPVRFAEGVQGLLLDASLAFLEVGPGSTLGTLTHLQPARVASRVIVSSLGDTRNRGNELDGALDALGRLWISGATIDWSCFYARERRRRVALPPYPFQRQRYWVDPRPSPSAGGLATTSLAAKKKASLAHWFYTPVWQEAVRDTRAAPAGLRWLVFRDATGIGDEVVRRLRDRGDRVSLVTPGLSDGLSFAVDPNQPADFEALLAELERRGEQPDRIAYLWGITPAQRDALSPAETDAAVTVNFYGLIWLLQALGETQASAPLRLDVVTSQMRAVTATDNPVPGKATAVGVCRVAPLEYPRLVCRSIDVEPPSPGGASLARDAAWLAAELISEASETVVACRAGRRWAQSFAAAALPPESSISSVLRQRGVYLITGGLGGIGLAIAVDLAKQRRAKLVLVNRSELPPRSEWDRLLSQQGGDDELRRKISGVLAIEAEGGEALVIKADVADGAQVRAALRAARDRFGEVHGVIHAAGIAGGRIIPMLTPGAAGPVFASKINATLALDEAFRDEPLDFFALCSSLASVLGILGQVEYCAANAFLDAYAHVRPRAAHRRTFVINWDTWGESGMAARASVPAEFQAAQSDNLRRGMTNREGVDVFRSALASRLTQVVTATMDLDELRAIVGGSPPSDVRRPRPAAGGGHPRPDLATGFVAPRDETERLLAELWKEVFGLSEIGMHDDFFELGGHSLLAVQLTSRIRDLFHLELPVRDLLDAPTVAKIAARIRGSSEASDEGDDQELAQALATVDNLSDAEVRRRLSDET